MTFFNPTTGILKIPFQETGRLTQSRREQEPRPSTAVPPAGVLQFSQCPSQVHKKQAREITE